MVVVWGGLQKQKAPAGSGPGNSALAWRIQGVTLAVVRVVRRVAVALHGQLVSGTLQRHASWSQGH